MWIERLEVDGFRRLAGSFTFAPGLNLVVGDNEAGKSSLHDALIRALFGFSERERRGGESPWRRSRPWDPSRPYRLRATVRDVGDRAYRIEWDFDAHSVRLLDAVTGTDESGRVAGKGKAVRLGEHLLGIDLENFRGICCLDQADVTAVRRSDWLTSALQQAVASVTSDVGVAGADERLKELVATLGYRTDTYRPTPTGRARSLAAERERLCGEVEQAAQRREQAQGLAGAVADRVRLRLEIEEEVAQLRGRLLRAELAAAERRLGEARRLQGEAADSPPSIPQVPFAEVDRVRAQIAQVEAEIAALEVEVTRGSADVETLQARRAALGSRYEGLQRYETVDTSAESAVREAWAALRALSGPATGQAPAAGGKRRMLWLALVAVTLGLAWLVRRAVRAITAWAARRAQAATVARQRQELERRLVAELDRVGAEEGIGLAERVEAYLVGCERRRERVELGRELAEVEAELARRAEPRTALERARAGLAELEAELRGLCQASGIPTADLAAAAEELERLRAESERVGERARRAQAAAESLRTLLAGETIADLERRRGELERRLREHEAAHGRADAAPIDLDEGRQRLQRLEEKLRGVDGEIARLQAELEATERDLPDVAELKERADALGATMARFELYRDAVKLARETLKVAAEETHRAFAPHLNEALARTLPQITNGRYAEATVADDLSLKVRAPETGSFLDPSQLSRGTQDQIFLVQRLEIARLLDPTLGAAPLLLDDPFAHFDPTRLRLGLELLAETAQARQVILFSEDPAVRELAGEVCQDVCVLTLAPVESVRARSATPL